MNKKQMAVLWLMVSLLSIAAVSEGIESGDALVGVGIPVILIGGILLYQFRDRPASQPRSGTRQLLGIVLGLVLVQTVLLVGERKHTTKVSAQIKEAAESIENMNSKVEDLESDVSDIKTEVDDVNTNVEALQR